MGSCEKITAVLAVMVMCLGGLDADYSYRTYDLNNYCGKVISLPCGHTASYRGGTLKFASYPARTCMVSLRVDNSNCHSDYEDYAIYYNVKELSLSYGDTVVVRENSTYYPYTPTVMKTYSGQPTPSYSPTSHDQFMTKTSRAPTFSITFTKVNTSPSLTMEALTLDYNVVHGSPNAATDSYCSALSGYVQDELICELSDRVNCPTSYTTYRTMSPANWTDQGSQGVCSSSTISPNVYRPYTSSYDTGVIVGAVFGSIAGFILIASLIFLACRNRTHHVISTDSTVDRTNQQSHRTGPSQKIFGRFRRSFQGPDGWRVSETTEMTVEHNEYPMSPQQSDAANLPSFGTIFLKGWQRFIQRQEGLHFSEPTAMTVDHNRYPMLSQEIDDKKTCQ